MSPRLPEPVVVVTARGLCQQAIFDTSYTYTIGQTPGLAPAPGEEGRPLYVGFFTSTIFYDPERQEWVWYSRRVL